MRTTARVAFLAIALATNCQTKPNANGRTPRQSASLTSPTATRSEQASADGAHSAEACAQSAAATCACENGSSAVRGPATPNGATPSRGPRAVGAALTGARRVSVAELLAKPGDFVGQTVRLEGEVTAMCHHARAWFAVKDDGQTGTQYLRVQTKPAFSVPPGVIGKRARTEGRVALVQVPAAMAQHYASDHGLGDPKVVTGPVDAPTLIATGAEFD
jgi:hypothetical protein